MKRSCGVSGSLCLAAVMAAGATAYADTFSFEVVGAVVSGSDSLTAVPDAMIPNAFDITGISGTLDINTITETITGLLPCATYNPKAACTNSGLTFGYDNVLYPNGLSPFDITELDNRGVGLELGSGVAVDIYASSSHQDTLQFNGEPGDETPILVSFTVTPEPSSFLLLGTGLLGMAAGVRRRLKS